MIVAREKAAVWPAMQSERPAVVVVAYKLFMFDDNC
jgi:hypothetical protein